jgi:hypothetical protein
MGILESTVATGNNVCTRAVRLRLIYSLKTLAHFRPKVLVDFLHSFTQINELTGAIIARHILRRIYFNNNYNYTILHSTLFRILIKLDLNKGLLCFLIRSAESLLAQFTRYREDFGPEESNDDISHRRRESSCETRLHQRTEVHI